MTADYIPKMSDNLDHLSAMLPDQKNYEVAYGLALKLAVERLAAAAPSAEICRRSGALFLTEGEANFIQLSFLNNLFRIKLPEVTFSRTGDPVPVELREKILILHYLLTASGRPLSNVLIGFKELGAGLTYYPTFAQRALQPLISHFGQDPEKILQAAGPLAGTRSDLGDVSVTIPAFAKVPLTFRLWRGDDEFPPDAGILFDRTVLEYLPLEDLIVLCQIVVWKLVKSLKL
jgi:hypothetical protein